MVALSSPPLRADVPTAERWNAESVFADLAAWQAEYAALTEELPQLEAMPSTITSAERLVVVMETISQFARRVNKLRFYASMSMSVDSGDSTYKALIGQIMSLGGLFQRLTAFLDPELLALDPDTLHSWVQTGASAEKYQHIIEKLELLRPHIRSTEVESVLGMVSEPFASTSLAASELTNTDLRFPPAEDMLGEDHPITQSNIGPHLQSADRERRRTAWQNYADSYLSVKNTLAATYIGHLRQETFFTRVRGYESTLYKQLRRFNIPVSVFHNLIDTYKANLSTWHRYWDVKRRALGVDTIHPYDIWAPIATAKPEVSFEQAVEWIAQGMTPLGDEYVSVLRRGCLEQRWVDYAPNVGKRQGAFSAGSYDTYPFIMMSFDHSLHGMSTLAHELGHSMHSYLSRKHQPEFYAGYSLFVAEVASNFNQALTRAYLFNTQSDTQFQIALIEEAMSNFHRYFFIMPTLARFELEAHTRIEKNKPLTADILNGIMSDLYAEGYGSTLTDDRERTGITWAQFGHLYTSYYTFQYATGISAAHALSESILAGDERAIANYLAFLRAGGSMYPLDALSLAGVDMNTPEAVERTFGIMAGLVDRLEALTHNS